MCSIMPTPLWHSNLFTRTKTVYLKCPQTRHVVCVNFVASGTGGEGGGEGDLLSSSWAPNAQQQLLANCLCICPEACCSRSVLAVCHPINSSEPRPELELEAASLMSSTSSQWCYKPTPTPPLLPTPLPKYGVPPIGSRSALLTDQRVCRILLVACKIGFGIVLCTDTHTTASILKRCWGGEGVCLVLYTKFVPVRLGICVNGRRPQAKCTSGSVSSQMRRCQTVIRNLATGIGTDSSLPPNPPTLFFLSLFSLSRH